MQKSQTISEIAKALILFQVKMGEVYKNAKNPFFKSSYATLSTIQESIKEPLIESGLTVCQFPTGDHGLTTIIIHESGEYLQCEYTMTPVKNDPQGIGSCITYQKRYALVSALNLNVQDEDDDGNKASEKPPEKPPMPTSAPREPVSERRLHRVRSFLGVVHSHPSERSPPREALRIHSLE
jgi:hypothetical protein